MVQFNEHLLRSNGGKPIEISITHSWTEWNKTGFTQEGIKWRVGPLNALSRYLAGTKARELPETPSKRVASATQALHLTILVNV